MQPDFWHEKWERNEIGFHQDSVNEYLRKHWSALGLQGSGTVFVPLCGKSLDMHWINEAGHSVLGVELSEQACRQFFKEAKLEPEVSQQPPFIVFRHASIQLYCGDFFALQARHLKDISAVYDRAALIALPQQTRLRYVEHLTKILPDKAQVLLVTMEYPQQEMDGPPFSVPESEVQSLFGDSFQIRQVHCYELGKDDPFAKGKGLSDMREKVYILSR